MTPTLLQTLYEAAVYTFEQVVFLLPEVPPDEIQRQRRVTAVATIGFTGPRPGRLQLLAAEGLLPRLTANMMGADVADPALQLDALGEIANIICGQVLPVLDENGAFQQTPPEVVSIGPDELGATVAPSAHLQLGVESSRADLLLYLYTEADAGRPA